MRLDLHEIIQIPGGKVSFDYEPDLQGLTFDSVKGFLPGARAVGRVENHAGVLVLTAELTVPMLCVCARCLKEFERVFHRSIEAVLATECEDEDDPDIFLLDGDYIETDEVVVTAFVLNMEQRFLCREDCRGLCEKCGKNLNEGPCNCRAEVDPRLAVLGQLLEKE